MTTFHEYQSRAREHIARAVEEMHQTDAKIHYTTVRFDKDEVWSVRMTRHRRLGT